MDEVNAALMGSPIIKGLLDAGIPYLIPIIGPGILSALDKRAAQLAEKNSRLFAQKLKAELAEITESKIDKDFVQSDEFVSLLVEILARNARAHEEEKVQLYARLFVNTTTSPNSATPYKEGFVRIVDELSVDHIRILSYIYNMWGAVTDEDRSRNWEQFGAAEIGQHLQIEKHRVIAYCDQMIRFGLLRDWMIGRYG